MALIDFEDPNAHGWIATALIDLRRRMAYGGTKPPHGVNEFEEWCLKKVRDRQGPSKVAEFEALAEAAAVTRMTYSLDDVHHALGVSTSSVTRLVREGVIPTVSIGGVVRVRATDLTAYLDSLPTRHPKGSAAA